MKPIALLVLFTALISHAQEYTRGIGVYPGDPKEYVGPALVIDAHNYRNLALHRPAYQSSAYDYNLTAQLITDGLKETGLPQWIATSTSDGGLLAKNRREVFLDGNVTSSVDVSGDRPWVEFDIEGDVEPPEIDHIDLYLRKIYGRALTGTWTYIVSGSDDRVSWKELGRASGSAWPEMNVPGPSFKQSIALASPARVHSYRINYRRRTFPPGESPRLCCLTEIKRYGLLVRSISIARG